MMLFQLKSLKSPQKAMAMGPGWFLGHAVDNILFDLFDLLLKIVDGVRLNGIEVTKCGLAFMAEPAWSAGGWQGCKSQL
jgi:hypothetical protein